MKKRDEFRHLTAQDRDRIHALYGYGHNQGDVARVLGVHKGTISRELGRYGKRTWHYSAIRAQKDAQEKRLQSKCPGMKIEAHPELRRYIIEALKKLRSPDEIAGRLKRDDITPRVGTAAIYKWLYSERGAPYCRYLCTKRHRKRRQRRLSKRIMIPSRISLRDRPEAPGLIHAEHDLFVSPTRLHSKPVGLLIVIPVAKLLAGSILLNRKSETVMYSTQKHFERVRADTTLADNGVENVRHKQNTVPTYFCDPGSPWQKPHVEGSIGLIRRWFLTKGTDLAHVPDTTFQSQLHLLNGKYRKSLGYRSAYEVALERGIITRVPRISLKEAVAFR